MPLGDVSAPRLRPSRTQLRAYRAAIARALGLRRSEVRAVGRGPGDLSAWVAVRVRGVVVLCDPGAYELRPLRYVARQGTPRAGAAVCEALRRGERPSLVAAVYEARADLEADAYRAGLWREAASFVRDGWGDTLRRLAGPQP